MDKEEEIATERRVQKDLDTVRGYKDTFNSPSGKITLYDLMRSCFYTKSTADYGMESIQFNEGRRSVIVDILKILEKNEEDILNVLNSKINYDKEYEL